jgi:hypothetical protein
VASAAPPAAASCCLLLLPRVDGAEPLPPRLSPPRIPPAVRHTITARSCPPADANRAPLTSNRTFVGGRGGADEEADVTALLSPSLAGVRV